MSFSADNTERLNRIVHSLESRAGNHDPRSTRVKQDALALIRDLVRENVRLEHEIDDLLTEAIGTDLAALDFIGKATRRLNHKKH